jgi:hypothetical protein
MPLLGREKVTHELKVGIKDRVNDNLKGVYLAGLQQIIQSTPADKGRARNNWFLTVGTPSNKTTNSESTNGASSLNQLSKLPESVLGKRLYFTNNLSYIGVLEYGGFPSPVKKGSYIKKSKSYQILSAKVFIKQAPNGWVGKTLILMQNKIRSL